MKKCLILGLLSISMNALGVSNEGEYSPAWSPDGKYLAYHKNSEKIIWDIMLKNLESGEVTQITRNPGYDTGVSWSPDGKQFVFSSSRSGNRDIYVYDLKSSETHELVVHASMENQPKWSPMGDKLAFLSRRRGSSQLFIYNFKTKETKQLTNEKGAIFHPSWTNDGEHIVFDVTLDKQSSIYQIELATGKVEKLYSNGDALISAKRYKDRILVTTNQSGNWDIITVDLKSGKAKNLVATQQNEIKGVLDASGKKLAYSKQQENGIWNIEVLDLKSH